jgi:exosortase B
MSLPVTSNQGPLAPQQQREPLPLLPLCVLAVAYLLMFLPTFYTLSQGAWQKDENGHGPMILALSFWLMWREQDQIFGGPARPAPASAFVVLVVGLLGYVLGRSQGIDTIEVAAQIPVLMAGLLLVQGWSAVRKAWFPLFFLIFMVPLPGVFTQMLTMPLKAAVSIVAEWVLHLAHYPIGRTGVTLVIGPYELLVADACSGLNSLFTLESLGLFYMKLMDYQSKTRNLLLATMIIPISFISNVTRVLTLVLITYYFGDAAGQGFMHGFAGMVLFTVALVLTYAFDRLLAARFDETVQRKGSAT